MNNKGILLFLSLCLIQELLVEEEEMGKYFRRKPKNQVVLEGQFERRPSWTIATYPYLSHQVHVTSSVTVALFT